MTEDNAIHPLTPPDCDLRDFPYLPMDIAKLFGSEFNRIATDLEWRTGVSLWMKSYHEVPAASLPGDDASLARLADLGRDLKSWRKIKAVSLRGWRRATDSRLYHPLIAEKALVAWLEKLDRRRSGVVGNAKRWKTPLDTIEIDAAIADTVAKLYALNPNSKILAKRPSGPSQKDRGATQKGSGGHEKSGAAGSRHDSRAPANLSQLNVKEGSKNPSQEDNTTSEVVSISDGRRTTLARGGA